MAVLGATEDYAIHLNGTSQYWQINDHANLDYAVSDAFTIGIWIRRDWDDHLPGTTYEGHNSYIFARNGFQSLHIDTNKQLVYWLNCASGAFTWETGVAISTRDERYFIAITGVETDEVTTLILYINGVAMATTTCGTMPDDTNQVLIFGMHNGGAAGTHFKGSMTGFMQSNSDALTAANILSIWNDGVYDIDTTEAILGVGNDSIGFEEYEGIDYDNALTAGVDGIGTGTPDWNHELDPFWWDSEGKGGRLLKMGGASHNTGHWVKIRKIMWISTALHPIVDGDILRLTDKHGRQFVHEIANLADTGTVVEYRNGFQVDGIVISEQTGTEGEDPIFANGDLNILIY